MKRKLLVLLILAIPAFAGAQPVLVTGNQYVWAEVVDSTGGIWFGAGPVADHIIGDTTHELSYNGRSYLSVNINDTIYTNQPIGLVPALLDLNDGKTSKIADTIETIWQRNGFDIVQHVYPVEFGISGTIVLSVEIVNHRDTVLASQAQYLLDDDIDGIDYEYAGARTLVRYPRGMFSGEGGVDIFYPDSVVGNYPVPPFFISYTQAPGQKVFFGDVIGVGYLSDSSAPIPLGLMYPSQLAIGEWYMLTGWGMPSQGGVFNGWYPLDDDAKQIQWAPTAARTGMDSVTMIARTCYGTGDIDICSGQPEYPGGYPLTVLTMYPHLVGTTKGKPTPNTYRVETMIFEDTSHESAATLSVTGGQAIVAPLPVWNFGRSQTQGMNLTTRQASNDFYDLQWTDSVFDNTNSSIGLDLNIADSVVVTQAQACSLPITMTPFEKNPSPIGKVLSRSGSYDGSVCNARCSEVVAYDTGIIRIPVLSVVADTLKNMSLSIAPNHAGADSTFYTVCVKDSMQNGYALIALMDSIGDSSIVPYEYCTIADTLPPLIRFEQNWSDTVNCACITIYLSDDRPWDRGLDSFAITNLGGFKIDTIVPKGYNIRGLSEATIFAHLDGPIDTICVAAFDLAGNRSDACYSFIFFDRVQSQPSNQISLNVFPDPVIGTATISIEGAPSADVEIFDVLGREVDHFQVNGSYDWQTDGLPSGTYIIRANENGPGNSQPITKRIVKE